MSVDILKQKRLRVTPFRKKVLNIFLQNKHAISVNDIEEVLGEHDRITLYRTIKSFTKKGIIHEIVMPGDIRKLALCEPVCDGGIGHHEHNHVHFKCKECDEVYCLPLDDFPSISIKNFTVDSVELQASGTCDKCGRT